MQALGLVWENLVHSGRNLREIRTPIAEPDHSGARLLLEHWWDRQSRGGIVMGRDLPSRSLASVLRNLAVFEPLQHGHDYRTRLAGAAFLRRFAREVRGLRLSEFVPQPLLDSHRNDIFTAMSLPEPVIQKVRVTSGQKDYLELETVHLRILAPKGVAPWALAGFFYRDWT